jgi:hypothetical protein
MRSRPDDVVGRGDAEGVTDRRVIELWRLLKKASRER